MTETWTRSAIGQIAAILMVSWGGLAYAALPAVPEDAPVIQAQMQELATRLDSPAYAADVSWDEHIVLVYRLAQHREPTPVEFRTLCALRDEGRLKRSDVLSLVLRGDAPGPSWDQCRALLREAGAKSVQGGADTRAVGRRLAAIPLSEIEQTLRERAAQSTQGLVGAPLEKGDTPTAPNETYNTYFGYFHAHSNLSDGTGSPLEAYQYARDVGHLDFFSLTDHGELLAIWPWDNKWGQLVDAANATYEPGTFATLWGFEWSNPLLGHICVVNSDDYTNTISTFWIGDFYQWLADRPNALGRFNHPGYYDSFGLEFLHFQYRAAGVRQMVGVEMFNGNNGFDLFYYAGSWTSDKSYWDVGNLNGWYLGALGGQDNHSEDWGTLNEFRMAILAKEHTREAIIDAYGQRRFYATLDKDLYLDFRCAGYPMGSRIEGVPRTFEVTASDGSGDTIREVSLYRNGDLFETKAVTGASVQATFSDTESQGADYYYVIVRLAGDLNAGRNGEAISSPIWIDAAPLPSPGCYGVPGDHDVGDWTGDMAVLTTVLIAVWTGTAKRIRRGKTR